ncbi:16S rRNA (cytidine(1402)-2'-O)-methyltransferase [Alphaproteobacteria bacterium]|nr:16S rRNA (cytidine(1402)-2'-O)-methyltransferase [Alphaproteobacteria bacterium]
MIEIGLYLVATPIGNLEDITIRAINVLKNSNLILCENTNNSKKLLSRYKINAKMDKYTDHDFDRKKEEIKKLILTGKVVSLISDSGSPLISDPGCQLINYLIINGIKIISIPGPSALISGIQLSGFLNSKGFVFLGFLPKKIEQKINKLKSQLHNNLIIYTTKQQIKKDIEAVAEISEHFDIIVLKELTKIHEQRITISQQNLEYVDLGNLKGELVLAISASPKEDTDEPIDKKEILYNVRELGMKKAYQVLKTKYKISRNEFYKLALELKNE